MRSLRSMLPVRDVAKAQRSWRRWTWPRDSLAVFYLVRRDRGSSEVARARRRARSRQILPIWKWLSDIIPNIVPID